MNNRTALPLAYPGYTLLSTLSKSSRAAVYRVVQEETSQSVVMKVMCIEHPSFSDLVQFRNQYVIAQHLNHPGIVKPIALERYGNGYALFMPDEGFVPLPSYWQENHYSAKEKVSVVLAIALQLAEVLHYLANQRIIHKDIKPANLLIHPETQDVQLIDFSIASLLPKEHQELANPNVLEGTLTYIAPEQTGRMNRGVDYRSDFYALGVTLYELLTGQSPFPPDEPMKLVHHHLTTKPPVAHGLNPDVPPILSAILLKLMAKNAEERYQSALGLKADLERCREGWHEEGPQIWFTLGEDDVSDRFLVPEKLYGRQNEVMTLLEAFNRASAGQPELMLVAGFSGVGKTAVVNEVHKPITRQNGYFIQGKFDQFNRNVPFSAFIQAFRSLIRQVLGESDTQLASWKTKILAAVGKNGQVLLDVIPELQRIIGLQPIVPQLSGSAAQNRFNLVFSAFVQIFTTPDHPLVIFLDDLQWADAASLNLLKLLTDTSQIGADVGYLLVLGAYRDNEVFSAHPLMLTLDEIDKQGSTIHTLTLAPLEKPDVNQFVADTLWCSVEMAHPLARLVYQKTEGNPFFATQFLQGLHQDGYIMFDGEIGHWQCDLTQVQQSALTNDVVEFMVGRLQTLPSNTQDVLKLAACIGNHFDLKTLALVCKETQEEVSADLWRSLQAGLVVPEDETYKFFQGEQHVLETPKAIVVEYRFLHDRVQQAAYTLIPDYQRASTHWQIGQLLLTQSSPEQTDNQMFEVVNQLNLGRSTIADKSVIQHLAQLNLKASQRAKLSAAYQAAQRYCETGIDLLSDQDWESDYELIYQLYYVGSEAAYLCGDFNQAERWYALALNHARTPIDQAAIYRVQMTQYQLQGRSGEAIAIQRQSLQLLGWAVPETEHEIQSSLDQQIAAVNQFLERHAISSLLEHPKMDVADIAEALRILQILFYAAWLDGQPTLALLALAKMTTLSLEYGNSDMSPFGYVGYGIVANAILNNAALAHKFGNMAVQLCEQFSNADVRSMTNFLFAADVHSWSRPLQESDLYYDNAYRYGMDAGNWLTVSFMMMLSGSDRLTYGKNLHDLYDIVQGHADFLLRVKSLENRDALVAGVLQPIRHLLGLTNNLLSFDDETFREADYIGKYRNTPYHLAWLYSVKIRHAYLFQQQDAYAELIPKLSIIEETVPTHAKVPSSVFYVALMHLALVEAAQDEAMSQWHWQEIEALETRLQHWQEDCPANIRHKCLLIQAEKARLNGQKNVAMDAYDKAIAVANAHGYGYEEALANELAAKFYLNRGKGKVAVGYMQEAYYCYARWGAKAKTDDLEHRYPQLLQPIIQQAAPALNAFDNLAMIAPLNLSVYSSETISSSSTTNLNTAFDFAAIFKAAQSISDVIQLDELLQCLTQIILHNSGGDRCILALADASQDSRPLWTIRAMATPDSTEVCHEPLDDNPNIPVQLIHYVKNTQEIVFLTKDNIPLPFSDAYLARHQPRSVLGLPLLNQGDLVGVLYLQSQLTHGVFTRDRILVLNFLCTQAAIALEKAHLYQQSQTYAQQLEASQLQLVQSEKMSALGNLVAGVAHEINNPLGFVSGNISELQLSLNDITNCLQAYRDTFPNPGGDIQELLDDTEIDFVLEDLPKMLDSMKAGCDRIRGISKSLRVFSRADTESTVKTNIHEGIDSTILILKYRLKAKDFRPAIQVIRDYGDVPEISCFPGQLNQVFMNILANAIDMFDEVAVTQAMDILKAHPQTITIQTNLLNDKALEIRISDNGKGMEEEVCAKIFDRKFTTKAVGKGTGLGLAIAHQVIVEKHNGQLDVQSEIGRGTEFLIYLPI